MTDNATADSAPATRDYRMVERAAGVERTREAILTATYELWLEVPYDDLTLERIAERADVSRQSIYRHFGSRDELFAATAEHRSDLDDEGGDAPVGDVDAAIRRVVDRYEVMGDANVRTAQLEDRVPLAAELLDSGRVGHRDWLERTFAPYIPDEPVARMRCLDALYAATDVMTWKLLRRDFDRSPDETVAVMRHLVDGALGQVSDPRPPPQ